MDRHAFIRCVVLLIEVSGCATTATPIVDLKANQKASDTPSEVLNPALGEKRPFPFVERRFKVEALRFKCLDEDGFDSPFFAWWISDEVVVVIHDPDRRVVTASGVFEEVDTGDSEDFAFNENCILPISGLTGQQGTLLVASHKDWFCSSAGIAGPFQFTVSMYEEDSGFFHDCFNDFPFGGCGFDIVAGYGSNDDLIGRRTLAFTAGELGTAMPNVNDTFDETITLGACDGDQAPPVCAESIPSGPKYTFTYRLTRLPDVTVGPVVDPNP